MNWLFSWIVAFLVALPLSFHLMDISGKPVDLVGSDLLFALLICIPRRRNLLIPRGIMLSRLAIVRFFATSAILYCGWLAMTAYAESSELSRIASAAKFIKPVAFVLLGSYLSAVTPPLALINRVAIAFAGVSLATVGTTACTPGFPQIAWGEYLFGLPIYGYRNSSMSMFGIVVPLILAASDARATSLGKWMLRGAAFLTALMVVMSLSRSSTIAMVCGTLLYLFLTGRIHWPVFGVVFGAVIVIAFSSVLTVFTQNEDVALWIDRLSRRFVSQTVEGSDPLSGRGGIWIQTIDLWSERPLCGYAFEAFSNYAEFDTPHQQYLEILYKSGAVGATLYGLLLLASGLGLLHVTRFASRRSPPWYLLNGLSASFWATMLGNLSQPNLTYSVVGNFLFFAIGLALNKHAAAGLVDQSPIQQGTASPAPAAFPHPRRARAA